MVSLFSKSANLEGIKLLGLTLWGLQGAVIPHADHLFLHLWWSLLWAGRWCGDEIAVVYSTGTSTWRIWGKCWVKQPISLLLVSLHGWQMCDLGSWDREGGFLDRLNSVHQTFYSPWRQTAVFRPWMFTGDLMAHWVTMFIKNTPIWTSTSDVAHTTTLPTNNLGT